MRRQPDAVEVTVQDEENTAVVCGRVKTGDFRQMDGSSKMMATTRIIWELEPGGKHMYDDYPEVWIGSEKPICF